MSGKSFCLVFALAIISCSWGCGSKPQPVAQPTQPVNNGQPSRPAPLGTTPQTQVVPAALPPPALPSQPAPSSPFHVAQHQIVDSLELGPGQEFEPDNGEKIVWVSLELKGGNVPVVVNLTGIKLTGGGLSYDVRGVGFGGEEASVQHLLNPGQSGTVTTSGPELGTIVYDTGARQVTFQQVPSRMSLAFVVPTPPPALQLEGLPGGKLKVR